MQNSPVHNDPALLKELSVRMPTLGDKPSTQYWQDQVEPEDMFVMNNNPFKKSNKPGRELAAIQGVAISLGYRNDTVMGKGKGGKSAEHGKGGKGKWKKSTPTCWRCGRFNHVSRDYHLPYQTVPAFGPARTKDRPKTTFNCGAEDGPITDVDAESEGNSGPNHVEHGSKEVDCTGKEPHVGYLELGDSSELTTQWWG